LDDAPGQLIIADKYQLLKQLGRGAMGAVWQAKHLTLRSSVAVKLMDPMIGLSPSGVARFLREARAAAELRSPHVVQILDHGVDKGQPYIVMEMLEGESLSERLRRVGRLSPRETARIVSHVARALARAERAKVVHRDLKPDNVFLVRNEDEDLAKVLDFGIAKVLETSLGRSFGEESTAAGVLIGTPYYMSPEQAEGLKTIDHRTDIWSLGVMAYECLLGEVPFHRDTLPALVLAICSGSPPIPSSRGPVPAGFDAWFARACAHDPVRRFDSALEAALQLTAICTSADDGSSARPDNGTARRPLSVPKLIQDEDDDEAPTEIWRDSVVPQLLGERLAPPVPAVPPAKTVPDRAITKAESKAAPSTNARGTRRWSTWAGRALALGALIVTGSGIGLWLGAQQWTPSALPAMASSTPASSVQSALAFTVGASTTASKEAAVDLPPPIDLEQLPLVPKATPPAKASGAPRASHRPVPAAATSSAVISVQLEDEAANEPTRGEMQNPYR
jgi:serine/threonine-protein kinase